MTRLILLLALGLGQAQPLSAALLCGQHHAVAEQPRGQDPGHHPTPNGTDTAPSGDHRCPSIPHDCAVMTGCTVTAPAIVPVPEEIPAPASLALVSTISPHRVPPSVSAPRPFHPPKV